MAAPVQSPLDAKFKFQPTQTLLDGTGHLLPCFLLSSSAVAGKQCGDFSSWVDCSGSSLRHQPTPTPRPHAAASGQMCLDSSGQLTAPLDCAMDCDTDAQVNCGSVVGVGGQGKSVAASAGGGGLHRFGFTSTRQASRVAGAAQGKASHF